MTRYKYLFLFFCGIISISLVSCSKYLDKKPDNLLTEDQIWQTKANAEAYLNNIYTGLRGPDGGDWATLGFSDESSCAIPTVAVRNMVAGNWDPSNSPWDNWGTQYSFIRKTFIFEQNIDKVPELQLSQDLKKQYKAENYFLRGYFYWLLLRKYGPYVIVPGLLGQDDDYSKYSRATFDACVANINGLMDQSAAGLPAVWSSSGNLGRITKGACMAIKEKAAQLAASPLWNGNRDMASLKNPDGTALAPATADVNKWRIAAKAAKDIIDSARYKLFTAVDKSGNVDAYLSVRDLFLTSWNDEIILASLDWSRWGFTKCASPGPGGYNMYNATQNVVDAFSMDNGRTIDDPASGYVETGFSPDNGSHDWDYKQGDWNMYVKREPRFYAYIAYNGRPVLPAVTVDDKNYYSSTNNINGTGRQEFYFSGKSGQKAMASSNITGYLPLKRISPNDNIRLDNTGYRGPYILIRYAEVLLDYVEALNEYAPGDADIVTYLNMVRNRAGLPGIETVYPGSVGNQAEMRKIILRERQVELCFESDRTFTLLRRKMLGNPENQVIYGMDVNADDKDLGFSFTGYYKRTVFQRRVWNNKMYLFPITQGDLERDRSLAQNPGW